MGDAPGPAARLRLPRFFVPPGAVGERISFDVEQQGQMRRVLRMRIGDRVIVCDGSGMCRLATLRADGPEIWGEPGPAVPASPPPRRAVWLYQSALRGERFAWLLQKGTEIGVHGFVPVTFTRTQPADYSARGARYGRIVREAAEQCERTTLPVVEPLLPFAAALAHAARQPNALCLLLDEDEQTQGLCTALQGAPATVSLFIGPEGGLTDGERRAAIGSGLAPVSLGRSILRAETAGLVAAALALAASGDLG